MDLFLSLSCLEFQFGRRSKSSRIFVLSILRNDLYSEKRIEKFRDILNSFHLDTRFDIRDLDAVMIDAIRQDDTLFTTELLSHGLPLAPDYALEAAKSKAKKVLEIFFEKGWDINNSISQAQPPVLR